MKNLNLKMSFENVKKHTWYYVFEDGKRVCTTKQLNSALQYFDIVLDSYYKRNN